MINIFTEKDVARAIDEYIKLREITGLARDTSKFGAIKSTVDYVKLRQAVEEDTVLYESKRQTDKLTPLEVKQ